MTDGPLQSENSQITLDTLESNSNPVSPDGLQIPPWGTA